MYIQLLIIGDFGLFGKHLWVLDYFSVDIGLYKINFHEVKFSFRDYELQETGFKSVQRQLNEMDWESSSFNQPSVKEDKQKNLLLEMYLMFATHALSILTLYLFLALSWHSIIGSVSRLITRSTGKASIIKVRRGPNWYQVFPIETIRDFVHDTWSIFRLYFHISVRPWLVCLS